MTGEEDATSRPRLRQRPLAAGPPALGDGPAGAVPFTLVIAGVVVTRPQLVAALQPLVPGLADIQAFEDGERFLFVLASAVAAETSAPPGQ